MTWWWLMWSVKDNGYDCDNDKDDGNDDADDDDDDVKW